MGKIKNIRFLIIVAAILLCVTIAFLIRYFSDQDIQLFTEPIEIEAGEAIHFSDTTSGAHSWFWEFGNEDSANTRSGDYVFKKSGEYMMHLTVDNKLIKKIPVNVHQKTVATAQRPIRIIAPHTAIRGEYVTFKGEGNDKEWEWEFGETGKIDSRDKSSLYAYTVPGTYEVLLSTETTRYPIRHTIEILPDYQKKNTMDALELAENDIKKRLQAIVNGEPFNPNFNYLLSHYLCNNPDIMVLVNNCKTNDFYSYCQGLRFIGKKNTQIKQVIAEVSDSGNNCITHLSVIQSSETQEIQKTDNTQ